MLSWQQGAGLAAGFAAAGLGLHAVRDRRARAASAFLVEASLVAALYAVWQLAADLSRSGTAAAFRRGAWIARFEHDVRLPSEASVQHLVLGHAWLVQAANLYYDIMHFTVIFIFLVWLYGWHRDRYREVRTTLAMATLACLAISFVPVSPPRLLPGFVDTAAAYGQSVYAGNVADQLSAMPSVHVLWAVMVGWYGWRIGRGGWRYLAPAHTVLTVFVVVCTGNHWWLDGVVAVVVLVACAWLRRGLAVAWSAARARRAPTAEPADTAEPEPVPA